MASVKKELQGAIVQRLKADSAVAALVNDRIFQRVPPNTPFPYVTYGPSTFVRDDAECINGYQSFIQIDVWSRESGMLQPDNALDISDAIERALHDAPLALPTNALVYFNHVQSDPAIDPDGLTTHVVIRFEGFIEQMPV